LLGVAAMAVGLVISAAGCAVGLDALASRIDRQDPGPDRKPKVAGLGVPWSGAIDEAYRRPAANRSIVSTVAGSTPEAGSGGIRQVSGTFTGSSAVQAISSTFKGGVERISEVLNPKPAVTPPDDPTSLATDAKPSAGLYLAMGRFVERSGRLADAERHYRRALALDPKHLGTLVTYARMKDRQGQLDEAVRLYRQAAEAHPNQPAVFNDLGLCFARQDQLQESIAALERAIRLSPKRPLYRNNIATVLVELGDVDTAFEQLSAVHDEATAYYNLAYLLYKKGESKAAAALFSKALASNPSLTEAKIWLEKLGNRAAVAVQPEKPAGARSRANDIAGDPPDPPLVHRQTVMGRRRPPASFAPPRGRSGTEVPEVRQLPPLPKSWTRRLPRVAAAGRAVPAENPPLPRAGNGTEKERRKLDAPPLPKGRAPAPAAPLPKTSAVRRLPSPAGSARSSGNKGSRPNTRSLPAVSTNLDRR